MGQFSRWSSERKRRPYNIWKNGDSKEDYVLTKKVAKLRVFIAKKKAEQEKMKDIETDTHIIYRIAKQMKQENKDTVGKKCIQNDSGVLAFNEDNKKAQKQHYESLLNVKFSWQ